MEPIVPDLDRRQPAVKTPFGRWAKVWTDARARAGGGPPAGEAPIRPEDYVGDDAARNERAVREGFGAKAKAYLRQLPMAEEVVALYFCMLDPRTPAWVKAAAAAALAYFILPIDAIPDLLPLVGLGDDAAVLAAALSALSAHITAEHRRRARAWMEGASLVGGAG
jgi:uncharacterized membrane protein YkvA (DUF1232 family)